MRDRATGWIQTFAGVAFYPLEPVIEDIRIEDIAHGLAGDNRFGCQMRQRYNTAQHSVYVSLMCPADLALYGLLHDGSEAYLRDIPRPIKHLPDFAPYRIAEKSLQALIYERFGLHGEEPAAVKAADDLMLGIEARDLMQPLTRPEEWEWCVGPARKHPFRVVRCWSPEEAEERFLARFADLTTPARDLFSVKQAAAILGRHAAERRRKRVAEPVITDESHHRDGLFAGDAA